MEKLTDQPQREQALNPALSFIVQAPAGSGKTELLVQRFLVLLANAQQAPEEIVAITFTRKAAAEMRERIVHALRIAADNSPVASAQGAKTQELARLVLQRDQALNWHLLQNPNRLRINTIDALCLGLVRQMPLLAKLGANPRVLPDAEDCYRQAIRMLINNLIGDEPYAHSLEVILSHLDNYYADAETLLSNMLAHRDQWLPHILQAKKATGLRETLQTALVNIVLERLQNCAKLFPDHLQPTYLMLVRFAASQLPPQHTLAACSDLTALPQPVLAEYPRWHALAQFLLTQEYKLRKQVNKNEGFPADNNVHCKSMKRTMLDFLAELQNEQYADFCQALREVCEAPPAVYTDTQWQVIAALVELLPILAAQLQLIFQQQNTMDFVGVASAAIEALGESEAPSQLALHLDYQIRHLLVDEFQDTSLTQFRLLELLTAGWQANDGRTLFLVGDPMQSIYRFRQAEVGLFLRARQQGIGTVQLHSLVLSANFRASPALIQWINQAFGTIFPKIENIAQGAICYSSCTATKIAATDDGVQIHPLINADAATEAAQIVQIIKARQAHYPQESIAILVRSRTHLQAIVPALQQADLPFQAVDIEKLNERSITDDLLALTRALFHLADQTAWLAVLRAPWCGLTLTDLHILVNQQAGQPLWQTINRYQELTDLSQDAQQRLQRCVPIFTVALQERSRKNVRQWIEGTWWALGGPACLLQSEELHYAQIYFDLLDEVALESHTLDLAAFNDKLATKYATPAITAEARLQIMTLHKAKGLEFDTVILPGLDHRQRQETNRLLMWMERPRWQGESELILAPIHGVAADDPVYHFLRQEQQNKNRYELARLLYVAATRAKKSLHLLGNIELTANKGEELKSPAAGSFLELLWPLIQHEFQTLSQPSVIAATPAAASVAPILLHRLKTDWQLAHLPIATTQSAVKALSAEFITNEPTNSIVARLIGSVVHQMLQKISQESLAQWHNKLPTYEKFWRKALLEQGLPLANLAEALVTITRALQQILQDQRGRWLLDNSHADAHSEYPLTLFSPQGIVNLVIDRTFVAEGVRWIVDYKITSPNENTTMADFLDLQQQQYQAQLQQYAQALHARDGGQLPIRLGLYFPLCGGWREWVADCLTNCRQKELV